MTMIYEVKEVGDNVVNYTTQMIMDMGQGPAPVGEASPMEWRYDANQSTPAAPAQAPPVQISHERVAVSGVEFDCLVITSGNTKTWVPATGDIATFPGLVKTQTDGRMTMELTRIEQPTVVAASNTSLHENAKLPANSFGRYTVTLSEPRTVSLRLNVRNNAPISYYFMPVYEGELYQGGGRDGFFYVQQFYGEDVRSVNESKCLAAGSYTFIVRTGATPADFELNLETTPGSGTPLDVTQLRRGGATAGGLAPQGPGRYRLSILGFNVSPLAKGNKAWDLDNSGPDVFFNLGLGEGSGVSNVQRVGDEQTATNTWNKRALDDRSLPAQWEFDWNGRGDVILIAWDRDAMGHDLIAAGRVQAGNEPASAVVKLQADLGGFLNGKLGRNAANGEITLILAWYRVQ